MPEAHPRCTRERQTITAMLEIYCKDQHDCNGNLCPECQELLEYSIGRLDHCPFQENKPTCAKCQVHCYKPAMREKVRRVMRYAGPRMLQQHPLLAVRHLVDGLRKTPDLPRQKAED
jgi:hypothetical protein